MAIAIMFMVRLLPREQKTQRHLQLGYDTVPSRHFFFNSCIYYFFWILDSYTFVCVSNMLERCIMFNNNLIKVDLGSFTIWEVLDNITVGIFMQKNYFNS